jgi:Fungal specific transcription factor domain.
MELLDELVGLYFRYIHITFHNLFHRPSFEAAVRNESIPRVLVFGVVALAARFSSHPYFANTEPQERGRPYAKEAERLLDLHKTCLTTVQACMLLGAIQVVEMDSATESIFYTVACRLAMILDLPNAPAKTRIEQEVNLRGNYDTISVRAMPLLQSVCLPLPAVDSLVVGCHYGHLVIYCPRPPQGNKTTL